MKQTAVACSNIAFIKFFGKKNEELRIPMNSSISMNLDNALTTTTVEFSDQLHDNVIEMEGTVLSQGEKERIVTHLNKLKEMTGRKENAHVRTKNTFPKGSGIASSASGFAALTLSASRALGMSLSEKELSMIARTGSGSACRSIPEGFVKWEKGTTHNDSYAFSLYPPSYWKLKDAVIVVDRNQKLISTTRAHGLSCTSPFLAKRFEGMDKKISECEDALEKKDFQKLGEIIEADSLNMHAVMMTAKPSLFYFKPESLSVMEMVWGLRKGGVQAYFTLDAGPTVHVIYEEGDEEKVLSTLSKMEIKKEIIINGAGGKAHIIPDHLF